MAYTERFRLSLLFTALSGFYASTFCIKRRPGYFTEQCGLKNQIGALCRSMPHKYLYGDYTRQSAGTADRSSAAVTGLLRSCVGPPLVQQEPGS